jgi:hypothetical protein
MRLRDHYDWIVLGDDPGALLSASLAAKLGLSVLILPLYPAPSVRITGGDDRSVKSVLDLESNAIPGFGSGGLWDACLMGAGMTAQEQAQILKSGSSPQVLTPQRRVLLDSDRARFLSEVAREWGVELVESCGITDALKHADPFIEKFWLDLPDRLTLKATRAELAKKTSSDQSDSPEFKKAVAGTDLGKLADQLLRSAGKEKGSVRDWLSTNTTLGQWEAKNSQFDMVEFCEGVQAAVADSQGSSQTDLFSVLHQLALSRTTGSFLGGMSAFREYLLRLARRNGADIPPKTECRQIFIQNGRFAGVLPSIRGSMIGGTGGILGVPLEYIQSMLTQSGRGWGKGFKAAPPPVGWKFTLALTLHPEAIPPGMARRVIWQEKGAPFIELERVHPSEYGQKDGSRVVLFLRTVMPMTEESLSLSYQRLISARLLRKAAQISPFLEYHIRKIYPDFRTEGTRELHEVFGFKALTEIPPQLLVYSGKGLGAQSGVEGLFLSSRESFPAMGMHGGAIAALEGVAWVAHRSGLAGPFQA